MARWSGSPTRRCCPTGHHSTRRSVPRGQRCKPAAPSSTPPPNGTTMAAHRPGCGNAGNSPPRWPTPAPTFSPGIWSPIASTSAPRLAPSSVPASAGTASGGDAPSPSCRYCSLLPWRRPLSPSLRNAPRSNNATSRCPKGLLRRPWSYAPPTQPWPPNSPWPLTDLFPPRKLAAACSALSPTLTPPA